MAKLLAVFGASVLFLALLGTFGIGNFVLIYGPDKVNCTKSGSKS